MQISTENFAEFLLNSPLAGIELDLQRDQSLPREIDLSAIFLESTTEVF